ncbi:MAG: VWA domain-containing protein [Planctomycetia bacterium]|nr:VWA domain-containing protein [Planctomycetia bacterium]
MHRDELRNGESIPSTLRLRSRKERRGAVLALVALFVVVLMAMAAFSIDISYIELVQTQLKASTDAASKAGTSALVQGKTDAQAISAAIAMAAQNTVAGKPLTLTSADIAVGQSVLQGDGSWLFVAGAKPSQAMQITSNMSSANANGAVNLFFAPVFGTKTFTTSNTSVASAFACEVCLVLDRSHSMCFDQTGTAWSYPLPYLLDWVTAIKNKPTTGSRWLALDTAINSFCTILKTANAPPRVSVVTWADDVDKSTTEYSLTGQTSVGCTTDLGLTTDMNAVYNAVHAKSLNVMLGGTEMSAGMDAGRTVLTGPSVKSYAKKVMILMTDGQWNAGRDPIDAADDCVDANITVHCVCFLKNADQTTTQTIATMTGGKFYYATDAASLDAAFKDLAYTLPVVLTK